jgi:hypothetical protein
LSRYGFDASTFNAVQGYAEWKDYFHHPDANIIGSVTTAYTVAAIVGGFFVSPWMVRPLAKPCRIGPNSLFLLFPLLTYHPLQLSTIG